MPEYGLPSQRDSDGELKAVDHTFEWGGAEVTIRVRPPTIAELESYEQLGLETETDELFDIVTTHLVEPDISDLGRDNVTARELNCYIQGIIDCSRGDANGLMDDVMEQLEARRGDADPN